MDSIVNKEGKAPLKINLQSPNRSITKYRCETTHNGHKNSLPKSCYQKYIRRGMFEPTVYWFLQGMLMPKKGIRSNHLNRIVCILTEDVSIKEVYLVKKTYEVLSKYRHDAVAPDQEDFREIIELLFLLCRAKKSRLGSHVLAFYCKKSSKTLHSDRFPEQN